MSMPPSPDVTFFALKAEGAERAETADRPSPPARPRRVRAVLDQGQAALLREIDERIEIDRMTGEVHRHDRARSGREGALDGGRRQIQRVALDIGEHPHRAHAPDCRGRSDEGNARSGRTPALPPGRSQE